MMQERQDTLHVTLLAATMSHLMLAVAKEAFPHRSYFDLASDEKQTVADHVRTLLQETQVAFSGLELLFPRRNMPLPPQREEEYL